MRRRQPRQPQDVRVLYLGGVGRSGSTLLDRLLDAVPDVTSAGELVHLWDRGVVADQRCGCGRRFSACPFWTVVGQQAFGGWDRADGAATARTADSLVRTRYIPMLARPGLSARYDRRLHPLVHRLAALYPAIADAAGTQVVVDSGKHASYAYLLRRVPGVDLRVLHVVRAVEGVAYSWGKKVARPETDEAALMPRYSAARVALRWTTQNVLFDALAGLGVPTVRIRYEDMVADPRSALATALRLASVPAEDANLAHVGTDWAELEATHSVAGNPMRFDSGRIPVQLDEAWRERLPTRDRRTVTALTWPVRSRYGYPVQRGPSAAEARTGHGDAS